MTPDRDDERIRNLEEVQNEIRDGDLLQFRARGLLAGIIARTGRGRHSHSGIAVWYRNAWGRTVELLCAETRELYGGRLVTLSSQVQRYPKRIDVYRANPDNRWPEFDREEVAAFMVRRAGHAYGWQALFKAIILRVPFLRLGKIKAAMQDDKPNDMSPFCSALASKAYREAGSVDPVLGLSDEVTEPTDLSRSSFFRYLFTLT